MHMIKRKVIHLSGSFDPFRQPEVINFLESVADQEEDEIVFDLKELIYLHYKSGSVLEKLKNRLNVKGKKLKLKNVRPYFIQVLNLSGHDWSKEIIEKRYRRKRNINSL